MKRWRNRLLGLALVFCLLSASLALLLRSDWLTRKLQIAVVNGIEHASGARVDMGNFAWSWHSLALEMRDFVMHGREPVTSAPLFRAPLIQIRLRILSLLSGDVQVASLVVEHPQLRIAISPDGTSNLPTPPHLDRPQAIVNSILDLKLAHLVATEGIAEINGRRMPFLLRSNNLRLHVDYRDDSRRYNITLDSRSLLLGNGSRTWFNGTARLAGDLWRDHFALTSSHFTTSGTDLQLKGTLAEFNEPVLDWSLHATLQIPELVKLTGFRLDVSEGVAHVSGFGHHDPQTPLFFDGRWTSEQLAGTLGGSKFRNGSLNTRFAVDGTGLQFSDLSFATPQGRFAGQGFLSSFRELSLTGRLANVSLAELASYAARTPLPWSATLSGPVELRAQVQPELRDATVNGDLHLAPVAGPHALCGDVRWRYNQASHVLSLEHANLQSGATHVQASGRSNDALAFHIETTNFGDLQPALVYLPPQIQSRVQSKDWPILMAGGALHAEGTFTHPLGTDRSLAASVEMTRFQYRGVLANRLLAVLTADRTRVQFNSADLEAPLLRSHVVGKLQLSSWQLAPDAAVAGTATIANADVQGLLALLQSPVPSRVANSNARGTITLSGTLRNPQATTQLAISNLAVQGEHLDELQLNARLAGNQVTVTDGRAVSQNARLRFSGVYTHRDADWRAGDLALKLDSNAFPLSRFQPLAPQLRDWAGEAEIHGDSLFSIAPQRISIHRLSGTGILRRLTWQGTAFGDLSAAASTENDTVHGQIRGTLLGSKITGSTRLQIAPGSPVEGSLMFSPVTLANVTALLHPGAPKSILSGSARGELRFHGQLEQSRHISGELHLLDFIVSGPPLQRLGDELVGAPDPSPSGNEALLQSTAPITVALANELLTLQPAELIGRDTRLRVSGNAGLAGARRLQMHLDGGVDLRILQIFSPDVQTAGQADLSAVVTGSLTDPQVSGSVRIANGSIYSTVLPNGLSNVNGSIRFDQHRATLHTLTARTGGGTVRFDGFVSYAPNGPLVYRLESTGQNIRIRYANGISVTGSSQFSLTGTSRQSLLSGGITVSRVVLNPSTDIGNILALTSAPAVAVQDSPDYLSRVQMDIHIESAPNLQLDTALSSGVQAEIDLQVRGTPKQPIMLGTIEANEGDIKIFGTRYSINRGRVSFSNAARLEPILDLDLQTQSRGITVDITISGSLSRLNINYRSDPPLQPREIIALLAVGRNPQSANNQSNVQASNDASSLQAGANTVLGQAVSPVSNRLSKLFGITNLKIDPLVQGITNTPQARLTLEQQISRQITVTYITNLSQTSEQIFRLEYALSPQFSLVALRDDNGEFGIDILYKKRFR